VKLRRRKNKSSSGVHHWLQPWQEMWWNAGQCRRGGLVTHLSTTQLDVENYTLMRPTTLDLPLTKLPHGKKVCTIYSCDQSSVVWLWSVWGNSVLVGSHVHGNLIQVAWRFAAAARGRWLHRPPTNTPASMVDDDSPTTLGLACASDRPTGSDEHESIDAILLHHRRWCDDRLRKLLCEFSASHRLSLTPRVITSTPESAFKLPCVYLIATDACQSPHWAVVSRRRRQVSRERKPTSAIETKARSLWFMDCHWAPKRRRRHSWRHRLLVGQAFVALRYQHKAAVPIINNSSGINLDCWATVAEPKARQRSDIRTLFAERSGTNSV